MRAILFDLDGVLADSHPVHESAWRALLAETGREADPGFSAVIREGRTRGDLLRQFYPGVAPDALIRLGERKNELYLERVSALQPVAGVIEFARRLKASGYLLAVATCAGPVRTKETLRVFRVDRLFDTVVTSADVIAGKPDPALFLLAAERLGVTPDQAIVFEDSVSGIVAAKRAGMYCVAYSEERDTTSLRAAGADQVISHFSPETLSVVTGCQEPA